MGSYDTVTVPPESTHHVEVKSGETFANKLIDISAPDAHCYIETSGHGWTIKNVGIKGQATTVRPLTLFGGGTVENFYLGDGVKPGLDDSYQIGCYVVHDSSSGPIVLDNVNISYFSNNGIYGSPTEVGKTGKILHIRNSYFDTNNISNFKIGSPKGTCTVENTTMRTDGNIRSGRTSKNSRAMWALDGHTVVRDCDIQGRIAVSGTGHTGGVASVELDNTRWNGQQIYDGELLGSSAGTPDLSPPAGVPTTPEQAASGRSGNQNDTGSTPSNSSDSSVTNHAVVAGIGVFAGALVRNLRD